MVIGIIILMITCIGIGGYGGYRLGTYYVNKENTTLRTQLMLQEKFSRTWAIEATEKYTLAQQVSSHQTNQLGTTMHMVIQMLQNISIQHTDGQHHDEQQKIEQLIAQARSLTSP